MTLTGQRTRRVFPGYASVDEGMLQEAGKRLTAGRAVDRGKDQAESGEVVELRP